MCLLTNATHIDRPKIYEAIQKLDKACLKLDTVNAEYIELVDRPNARYDLPRIIDIMKSRNGRCVIQTMFMKGEWQGKSVDNTGDEYVLPWLEVVKAVAPSGVDIYTISRDTPGEGLKKASKQELDHIAGLVQSLGIDAHAYYKYVENRLDLQSASKIMGGFSLIGKGRFVLQDYRFLTSRPFALSDKAGLPLYSVRLRLSDHQNHGPGMPLQLLTMVGARG